MSDDKSTWYSLRKNDQYIDKVVKQLRISMDKVDAKQLDFSSVKRAFGTEVMQGTNLYENIMEQGIDAVNNLEATTRNKANFAPRNESHHVTGLKIVTNPILPAARKQGSKFLKEYIRHLDNYGYEGYGNTGQNFVSLPKDIHIGIGHRGDARSSFMNAVLPDNVDPRLAAETLQPHIDDQLIASLEGSENVWMARQRKLIRDMTGVDPQGNPVGAKKAAAALKINARDLADEVDRQVGADARYQTTLSAKDQAWLKKDPRGFIQSRHIYELFNNPTIRAAGVGAAIGLLSDPNVIKGITTGNPTDIKKGGERALAGEAISQGVSAVARKIGPGAVKNLGRASLGIAAGATATSIVQKERSGQGIIGGIQKLHKAVTGQGPNARALRQKGHTKTGPAKLVNDIHYELKRLIPWMK